MNTIFAICTPPIQSTLCIFRISGPKTLDVIEYFQIKKKIIPRLAHLVQLISPNDNTIVDNCIMIYFPKNNSFTGEEVIELHTHGSIAIQRMLTQHLNEIFQPAQPGEFTRQAIINKKMNLIQAEGLHDLITSYTPKQHQQATNQIQGILYKKCNNWKNQLITLLSQIEGHIDFEDDIPTHLFKSIYNQIKNIQSILQTTNKSKEQGIMIRDGIKLGIFGNPNSGKSTLMNKLTSQDTSIVSTISGTTTDIITNHINLNGYPIILHDTAGININSTNQIEQIGIQKSLQLISKINIKIIIIDLTTPNINTLIHPYIDKNTIVLLNKNDLPHQQFAISKELNNAYIIKKVSILNDNTDLITQEISNIIQTLVPNEESIYITQERHYNKLTKAINYLEKITLEYKDLAIISDLIRRAIDELATLVESVDDEEILDQIFKDFCVGK